MKLTCCDFRLPFSFGLALLLFLHSHAAFAAEPSAGTEKPLAETEKPLAGTKKPSATSTAHRQTINTILAGEAFNRMATSSGWRLKDRQASDDEIPEWLIKLIVLLESLLSDSNDFSGDLTGLADFIEIVLWLLLAATILYLVYRFKATVRNFAENLLNREKSARSVPTRIAGLDITRASLPDDVVATATALWNQQHFREALGLLYRATLSRLVHDYQCPLSASYTERECLQVVGQLQQTSLLPLMKNVTRYWLQLAYGHQSISSARFAGLCRQWQQTFVREYHHA